MDSSPTVEEIINEILADDYRRLELEHLYLRNQIPLIPQDESVNGRQVTTLNVPTTVQEPEVSFSITKQPVQGGNDTISSSHLYVVVSSSKPGTASLLVDQDHYHIWKEQNTGEASHDMTLTITPRQRPVAFTMETPGRWNIRLTVTNIQGRKFFREIAVQVPEQMQAAPPPPPPPPRGSPGADMDLPPSKVARTHESPISAFDVDPAKIASN